jgi:peptidoglycan hydrolase-like protein with peptidoglycan-binding domain
MAKGDLTMRCCLKHSRQMDECMDCGTEMNVATFIKSPQFADQIVEMQADCIAMYTRLNRIHALFEYLDSKEDKPARNITEAIIAWQQIIGATVTGLFDANTYALTREWQKQYGIEITGEVKGNTWAKAGYPNPDQMPVLRMT